VWALRDVGCEAAIAGKALYERRLKLSQVTRGGGVRS
jgi:phosphoribosylformimino-5-aminoimidazole carboxamide ribonucleotide (ProFAR) isomerase